MIKGRITKHIYECFNDERKAEGKTPTTSQITYFLFVFCYKSRSEGRGQENLFSRHILGLVKIKRDGKQFILITILGEKF